MKRLRCIKPPSRSVSHVSEAVNHDREEWSSGVSSVRRLDRIATDVAYFLYTDKLFISNARTLWSTQNQCGQSSGRWLYQRSHSCTDSSVLVLGQVACQSTAEWSDRRAVTGHSEILVWQGAMTSAKLCRHALWGRFQGQLIILPNEVQRNSFCLKTLTPIGHLFIVIHPYTLSEHGCWVFIKLHTL